MSTTARAGARLAAAPLLLVLLLVGCGSSGPRTIRIDMRYSRFLPASFSVAAGETVHLLLVNRDPIAHELILGDGATQDRHEVGTEQTHDGMPGQASLEAGETQTLVFTFPTTPGTLLYGCHRPGHYAYGMRGTVRIPG